MHRGWLYAVGVLFVLLVGAFYAWLYVLRDTTSRTDVGDVVTEFRQEAAGGSPRFAPGVTEHVPDLGVYRYRTTGGESVDLGLIERSHDYDGVSTITLTATRCGVRERWQVLDERWTVADVCLSAEGARLRRLTDFREFLGQSNTTGYTCTEEPRPFTAELREGMTWTTRCSAPDGESITQVLVEGTEQIEVAGRSYSALRLSSESDLQGDPDGSSRRTSWHRLSDGLLLRRTATSEARVETAGGGDFSEQYTLDLISPRPIQ